MKWVVALLIVAVAHHSVVYAAPSLIAASPLVYGVQSPILIAQPAGSVAVQAAVHPALVGPAPVLVAAPPAIQPGYVAATRGAVHIAPLPGNQPLASHHLNLAPAPGTI